MRVILKVFAVMMVFGLLGCGSVEPVARIIDFSGKASFIQIKNGKFVDAEKGKEISDGGAVRTSAKASLNLEFIKDKSSIRIDENTFFEIKNFSEKQLKQMQGVAIYKISPQDKELTVETPHGMATVLGTVFRLETAATFTQLIVETGTVEFSRGQKKIKVTSGQLYSSASSEEKAETVDPFDLDKLFSGKDLRPGINLR